MQKKTYTGVEISVKIFGTEKIIAASGEGEFVPEVSTGPNDLPILPG